MRCPACAGDNAPDSKFCGVCGLRLAPGPPTVPPPSTTDGPAPVPPRTRPPSAAATAPLALPSPSRAPAPALPPGPAAPPALAAGPLARSTARPPAPPPPSSSGTQGSGGGSLDGSLRLPEARGAWFARMAIVLAFDAGLVIGGVVLATHKRGPAPAAVVTTGPAEVPGPPPGPGSDSGPGSGAVSGPGSGHPSGPDHVVVGPGSHIDGGVIVFVDAGPRAASDAAVAETDGGVVLLPDVDAAAAVEPVPIDAALAPEVDAAVAIEPAPIDAAPATDVDADLSAVVSADEIVRQANHLAVTSASRLQRCYQSATKVLPADQALHGQVDIGLAVLPTGVVDSVQVLQNSTGSDQLGQCVQAVVQGWTFSPHDGSEPVHVSRPFSF